MTRASCRASRTPLHLPEDMGAWVADLIAKGYDLPNGRDDVFRPAKGFEKPADRGYRFIPTEFPGRGQRDRLSRRRVPEMAAGARADGRGSRMSSSCARIRR